MVNKGGDGGEIFIFGKTIKGNGEIVSDGGIGSIGGRGGKVTIVSEDNKFTGKVSTKGGVSFTKKKWWENNWIQLIMLISAVVGIIGFVLYLYTK